MEARSEPLNYVWWGRGEDFLLLLTSQGTLCIEGLLIVSLFCQFINVNAIRHHTLQPGEISAFISTEVPLG